MGTSRFWIVLLTFAVLAAACGPGSNDNDETTTSAQSEPETTDSGSPDTTEPGGTDTTEDGSPPTTTDPAEVEKFFEEAELSLMETLGSDEDSACFFSAHHLFAFEEQTAVAAVNRLGQLGILAVIGYIADPLEDPGLSAPSDPGISGPLIVTFDGSQNSFVVSEVLRSEGIEVEPVLMVGMAGHWQAKPGSDPVAANARDLVVPATSPDDSKVLGVVDTGLESVDGYQWVLDGVRDNGLGDDHDLPASHGTFIASIIRQADPSVSISFAKMEARDKDQYFQSWPEDLLDTFSVQNVSSEIDAYAGINVLIDRHVNDRQAVRALSLSWGTYPCNLDPDSAGSAADVRALGITLADWWLAFDGAPVFAAAGNEEPVHGPFYPAAFPEVVGVAAASGDPNSPAVVWDGGQASFSELPWASVHGPGCNLVGVAPPDTVGPVISWSGSSFATPMMALSWMEQGIGKADADQAQPSVSAPSSGAC